MNEIFPYKYRARNTHALIINARFEQNRISVKKQDFKIPKVLDYIYT